MTVDEAIEQARTQSPRQAANWLTTIFNVGIWDKCEERQLRAAIREHIDASMQPLPQKEGK